MDQKKVFKKTDEVVAREIEGEVILMPMYKTSEEVSYIYTLNETSKALWEKIDGEKTVEELKKEMLEEYDVGEDKAGDQVEETLNDFISIKAIE